MAYQYEKNKEFKINEKLFKYVQNFYANKINKYQTIQKLNIHLYRIA